MAKAPAQGFPTRGGFEVTSENGVGISGLQNAVFIDHDFSTRGGFFEITSVKGVGESEPSNTVFMDQGPPLVGVLSSPH